MQAQKSHKVRIHDVRLISRGHPGSVGGGGAGEHRGADLLHIFERRRAIIDSAIVRILKREKEMSMDNMASKVGGRPRRSFVHVPAPVLYQKDAVAHV